MAGVAEALGVDLVDLLRAEGRAQNQPSPVTTLTPPIAAPLPGATLRTAVMGSPASVSVPSWACDRFFSTAFCSRVAGASMRA